MGKTCAMNSAKFYAVEDVRQRGVGEQKQYTKQCAFLAAIVVHVEEKDSFGKNATFGKIAIINGCLKIVIQ